MKHSRIIVGIAVVACCAVVALGVWQDRKEATFAPWARDMVAPITVGWGEDLATYHDQIQDAIAATNKEVGCELFIATGLQGSVTLLTSARRDPCGGYQIQHPERPTTVYCSDGVSIDVVLDRLGAIEDAYVAVRHELGHVAGLDHDSAGLMGAVLPAATLPMPSLSSRDRQALRGRYCRP